MPILSDVNILLSIVNMKLRDTDQTLKDIFSDLGYEEVKALEALKQAGFVYNAQQRQFKSN